MLHRVLRRSVGREARVEEKLSSQAEPRRGDDLEQPPRSITQPRYSVSYPCTYGR